MAADDPLITIFDDPADAAVVAGTRWKIAIVDDDLAVHDGTRFALSDFRLNGRGLEFVSATSAAGGRELLARSPDIAVILLDVVMESDVAGLELVDYVRRELGNEAVRIILRTGQPGHAPEQRVVVEYDINDYKAKTELTAEKLFTAMTAALRSFEQLRYLTRMRQGLEIIVGAASQLHQARTVGELAETALRQLELLVEGAGAGALLCDSEVTGDPVVHAATGRFRRVRDAAELEALAPGTLAAVDRVLVSRGTETTPGTMVACVPAGSRTAVVVLELASELGEADRALAGVFLARLTAAFENVTLYEALEEANAVLEERVVERSAQLSAANARLAAQADELRRVNALKNELLGLVAHDLKNPLGVILGRAEILAEAVDNAADPAFMRKQLDAIRDGAHRLTRIVDARIADARRDAPEVVVRRAGVDLAGVVRRAAEGNRAHAERKRQTLLVAAPGPLVVAADEDRLAEAIDNLVSNALKYSPVGGAVTVTAERSGEVALVRVADDGPGIAPADRARLFLPFQRLSATPTGGEGSTGLGLYSAKRIVDLHGGHIGLEDGGTGATFVVALPLAPVPR